jgi:hypothetical protein
MIAQVLANHYSALSMAVDGMDKVNDVFPHHAKSGSDGWGCIINKLLL